MIFKRYMMQILTKRKSAYVNIIRNITKDKEPHFIMIEGSLSQEDIIILTPKSRVL